MHLILITVGFVILPFMLLISGHPLVCADRNYVKSLEAHVIFCDIQGECNKFVHYTCSRRKIIAVRSTILIIIIIP